MVEVFGEEDIIITKPADEQYIEAAEEAVESSFQTFEVVNTVYGKPPRPRLSKASLMAARMMVKEDCPLKQELIRKAVTEIEEIKDNTLRVGLGYHPTRADKARIRKEKREKRMARIQNREPEYTQMEHPPLEKIFRSAGWYIPGADNDQGINMIGQGEETGTPDDWIRPCKPNQSLNNWKILELPISKM